MGTGGWAGGQEASADPAPLPSLLPWELFDLSLLGDGGKTGDLGAQVWAASQDPGVSTSHPLPGCDNGPSQASWDTGPQQQLRSSKEEGEGCGGDFGGT